MKRFFILALLAFSLPATGRAQGGVPADPIKVIDSQGRPRAGATITFCTSGGTGTPCTPLASIFTDAGLTNPASNPVTTDGLGNLPVIYAAPGVYKYSVTGTGITPSGPFTATVGATSPALVTAVISASANPAQGGVLRLASTDTACWRNNANSADLCISKTSGDLFQLNGDTFATLTASQALTGKTFDISLNTLKTTTNTAGHVPRNNGTQYVDSTLAAADLSNGVTGSGAVALATSPALTTPTIGGETVSAAPRGAFSGMALSLTSTGRVMQIPPDKGITVTSISYTVPPGGTLGSGCTSAPQVRVTDGTTLSSTLTLNNSSGGASLTGLSVNYAAAADLRLEVAFAASGCTTNWANVNFVVQYKMQ